MARPAGWLDQAAYRADCSRCVGLCCTALTLIASADFAIDKPAGEPCRHLGPDHSCRIHAELPERGFPGCVRYDCFGAGQRITAATAAAAERRAGFPVLRQLQELLCYLAQAATYDPSVTALAARVEAAAARSPAELPAVDVAALRAEVAPVLIAVSDRVRAPYDRGSVTLRPGANRAGADLRGASLRNALLIAVDLTDADLRHADLLGADVRDVRVGGADLSTTLFLSRTQANGMHGDARTRWPPSVQAPRRTL